MTTQSISDTTRENAIALIQRAYAEGRINEPELEHRLSLILEASSVQQLRMTIADLPASPQMVTSTEPRIAVTRSRNSTTDAAALIHFSGLLSGPIGPGLAWAMTEKDSIANREAAKALNYQLLFMIGFIATGLLSIFALGLPVSLWSLGWLAVTIVSAIKASRGEDWENPLTQITGFRPITR